MNGIAGYKAQLKLGGIPTGFLGEDLTQISPLCFRITDPIKRVLSVENNIEIKDGFDVTVETLRRINYLEGVIYFEVDPSIGYALPFTISGVYIPLLYIGGSKDYSLEIAGDVLDDSSFHSESVLSAGYRSRIAGLHDISVSFSRWNDFSNALTQAKLAKTPVFVAINPGGSKVSIRGWYQIETDSLSGDVGSLEDQALSLVLCDNQNKTSFSYCYDYSDAELTTLGFADQDSIDNWFY